MKIKFTLTLAAIFVLASIAFSQSASITPKKTVYIRKGKNVPKGKRNFTITYPIVSASISPSAKKKLSKTINYWRVFETTLAENLGEYHWLSEMYYKVNYNKNGILDISLTQEGVGAYPDAHTVNLIVDLKTGEQVKFGDVFRTDSREKFAQMVNQKLEAEKKAIIKSIEADKTNYSSDADWQSDVDMIANLKFTPENFEEFSVSDKGAAILYDAGFPHAVQALQPDGRYFFSWAELKPFIKPGGLLGKFIR